MVDDRAVAQILARLTHTIGPHDRPLHLRLPAENRKQQQHERHDHRGGGEGEREQDHRADKAGDEQHKTEIKPQHRFYMECRGIRRKDA
jgi:hypothetical protein